jgi:hypothetical protein
LARFLPTRQWFNKLTRSWKIKKSHTHTQTKPRTKRTILLHTVHRCGQYDKHECGNYVVSVQHVKRTTQEDKMIIEWYR